jgi:hypothetical protein
VLFSSVLSQFTAHDAQALPNYMESTALHEFGHQLGLLHNDHSDCLMQAYIDQPPSGYINPTSIITDFCDYEKQIIARAKD